MTFVISLDKAAERTLDVDYSTTSGTATESGDFERSAGTVRFQASETTKNVVVNVLGDTTNEADETFTMALSSQEASLGDSTGQGTIANDDAPFFHQITTGVGPGVGAHVRSFNGATPTAVSFAAFGDNSPEKGGVRVARRRSRQRR